MNFRQRMAWLCVVAYLALTCFIMYYIFEINDGYNAFALDHVEKYHSSDDTERQVKEMLNAHLQKNNHRPESADEHDLVPAGSSIVFSFLWHITDIPLAVWMLLLVLPYLQVFCMLLACTKQQPQLSMAYLWPVVVYIYCKQFLQKLRGNHKKSIPSATPNGHSILNT